MYKENDGSALIPVHRTVGMDGPVSVAWSTRDISAMSGKHYVGGRGVLHFADGQVRLLNECHTVSHELLGGDFKSPEARFKLDNANYFNFKRSHLRSF